MFYYLLAGASEEERKAFHLKKPEEYHYLSQVGHKRHDTQSFHLDAACLFHETSFTQHGYDCRGGKEEFQDMKEAHSTLLTPAVNCFVLFISGCDSQPLFLTQHINADTGTGFSETPPPKKKTTAEFS